MTLVQEFLSQNAGDRPESLFIKEGNHTISYGVMDENTNRLARTLKRLGVTRGDGVALLLPKSISFFEAMLATLKADAYYLPLNPESPEERNRAILNHSGSKFVVCHEEHGAEARSLLLNRPDITLILWSPKLSSGDSARSLRYENSAEDVIYVLYTSGSTGEPKGVMIKHSNVTNYAEWTTSYFGINPEDRLSNHPAPNFDLSVFDIYSAMKAGASLHLVPPEASLFPIKIIDFIQENQLTVWNSVPSLYTSIRRAKALDSSRLTSLRALTFNGEVMPTSTLIEWMRACPSARFVNQYGPTETTCASLFYELSEIPTNPATPVPIGVPITNTEAFALSQDGDVIGEGEVGELYIGGAGVGSGYLHDPEKTRSAYIARPNFPANSSQWYRTGDLVLLRAEGGFDFVGRKDFQIKVRGHRVELGAVEAAVSSLEYVASAAALGVPEPRSKDIRIVVILVLNGIPNGITKTFDDADIRADLRRLLPDYMLPKTILRLEKMPLNSNGKVDRASLRASFLVAGNL